MALFLEDKSLKELDCFSKLSKDFARIKFIEVFKLLYNKTKNKKYKIPTIKHFGAYEEVLLTEIIGESVFVEEYIKDEVVFYHAKINPNSKFVKNADLLFLGYGEIIGSGERVHTKKETA